MLGTVENLKINFKTMEEFNIFKEFGLQELSMLEEIQMNFVEDHTDSPFYGIYYGGKLVARMCLYMREETFEQESTIPKTHLEIWKLEVLSDYQNKGFGRILVDYAKSFHLPIITKPRVKSHDFWKRMGFRTFIDDETRFLWIPDEELDQKIS
ncbi:GNAT superfamily N-acetyltransferase [Oikeobacillus pervagus]|uniref:GNAT superfamily N-acetyltransferase n=1 Tax=Oikeobacillus pervagus TaxID=1325931 RepID=A0AAJ1T3G7_9BACI|nr:GNAT family N-acetyltransferase [Oikeobacillus pervagus]MDQ0215229.1 GNAT superfamily N-acetyltransferase [Oikeobacillus pervagus]